MELLEETVLCIILVLNRENRMKIGQEMAEVRPKTIYKSVDFRHFDGRTKIKNKQIKKTSPPCLNFWPPQQEAQVFFRPKT